MSITYIVTSKQFSQESDLVWKGLGIRGHFFFSGRGLKRGKRKRIIIARWINRGNQRRGKGNSKKNACTKERKTAYLQQTKKLAFFPTY